jgi:hypothetical protein
MTVELESGRHNGGRCRWPDALRALCVARSRADVEATLDRVEQVLPLGWGPGRRVDDCQTACIDWWPRAAAPIPIFGTRAVTVEPTTARSRVAGATATSPTSCCKTTDSPRS